jgi:sugar phosphate isomerase/epimerase
MNSFSKDLTRRQAIGAIAAAGLSAGLFSNPAPAAEEKQAAQKAPMLLGVDSWSFSFAAGLREVKPAQRMTAWDMLAKVRQWGLKGAQVEIAQMPKLGSSDFAAFRKAVQDGGLYWEVSAGRVHQEDRVLQALEYNVALGSKVVRSYMEGFGVQFKFANLDAYVSEAIAHIKNLLPTFEKRGLHLCLENHGGLRMKHLRRVFKTFPSEHLGLNLDTGNPVLTLEDPVEVVQELAPRAYTCHLKDWNLIRHEDGLIVRSCALGDGVVDLKAVLEAIRAKAPRRDPLHLNIEAPQEYLPLKLFTAEFWRWHGDVPGRDLGNILRLTEAKNIPPRGDYRIASMRGEPESEILAEEEAGIARSVAYCRDVLRLV